MLIDSLMTHSIGMIAGILSCRFVQKEVMIEKPFSPESSPSVLLSPATSFNSSRPDKSPSPEIRNHDIMAWSIT